MGKQKNQNPLISLRGISKNFGVTQALKDIHLEIYPGEVIGLVGPNGAGKSTLIKILTGVLAQTDGQLFLNGIEQNKYSPKEAKDAGISCAYQDLSLCTNLKVYENFALLNMSHSLLPSPGWRNGKKLETKKLLERYFPGNDINVMRQVSMLSLAEQQVVEICKTLMTDDMKLLVLDEPTSALSTDRASQLHQIVREFSKQGVAIIFISHKLEEIKTVSDRIIVMRNGQVTSDSDPAEISSDKLVELMGGAIKKKDASIKNQELNKNASIIEINDYSFGRLSNISFNLRKGEILGLSGLAGSGQEELLKTIFHYRNKTGHKNISVNGTVSYVSGDRTKEGVFPIWSIFDNILISSLKQIRKGIFLDKDKSERFAQTWYDKLKFKAEGIHSPITSLSGGNQQKALIARGIASGADTIILNDPTAGVDIETKQEIYALFQEAKSQGKSIILYSTEDAEMEVCDRAYVMREGRITEELIGSEVTVPNIIQASFKEAGIVKTADTKRYGLVKQVVSSRVFLPLVTLFLMVIVNAAVNPNILKYNSIRMLLGSALPLVFAALGQLFIVTAGDIDMGNGYSIGLVNVLVATILTGRPLIGLISLIIFIGAYILMGTLIHLRNIPSIVVTLGAQFVWLGLALIISPTPGGSSPQWLVDLYRMSILGTPMPGIIIGLASLMVYLILFRSKYGMVLRGIGNNPTAVDRSGWSYITAKMTNYGLSALMVVFAGISFTAISMSGDANSAASFTMMSIATVILGGCKMSGGEVEPIGVAAGAIAMSLITSLLTFVRVDSNYQTAVTGLLLIFVLALNVFTEKRKGV